jgi:hypothetical protein
MAHGFSRAALAALAAGSVLLAPAATMATVASAATSPSAALVGRQEPWHDPHCTSDGRWHNDNHDQQGHPDPRCPRW